MVVVIKVCKYVMHAVYLCYVVIYLFALFLLLHQDGITELRC